MNALNSILSYIQRPKSIDVLESMGIAVFTDSTRQNFRNAMELFRDIAASWNAGGVEYQNAFVRAADDTELFSEELAIALGLQDKFNLAAEEYNDIQKRDIAQASAGVYRRNYFIGMIERMANTQDVLNGMMDASGYSMRENANTMDSLEKKYISLKASVEQLAVALGDAGLLDMLKSGVDVATDFTTALGNMDEEGQALLLTALELITAFTAIKAVGGMLGFDASFAGTGKGLQNLLLSAGIAAPGWTKLIPLIGGVVAALGLYAYNVQNADNVSKAFAEKQEKLSTNYEKQKAAIQSTQNEMNAQAETAERLANKIYELTQKESLNITEKAQMKSIVEQLNGILPDLSLKFDEQTGKVEGNTTAIYDNIEALKKQVIAQAEAAQMQATAKQYVEQEILAGDVQSSLDSERAKLASLQSSQAYSAVLETRRNAEKYGWSNDTLGRALAGINKQYGVSNIEQQIYESKRTIDELTTQAALANLSLAKLDNELNKYAEKSEEVFGEDSQSIIQPSNGGYVPTSSSSSKTSSYTNPALSEALKFLDYKKYINELTTEEEIAMLNDIKAQHVKTADELMDINKRIYSAEKQLVEEKKKLKDDASKLEEDNIKHLSQLGIYSVQQQIEAYKELYSVKAESMAEEQSRIENLFNLYKQLLSEEQKKIKDAYDERIRLIDEETDRKKKARQEEIEELQEQLELLDRKDNQRSYEQTITDLKQQIEYWSVRTSEDARKKVIELEKQIDEEKYKHDLEKQKQSLNDKIDVLEDEIDEIEDAANEEKKKWEKSYKQIEKAFDSHSMNIVALAASMSNEAYQEWVNNYLIPLQSALSSGNFDSFDSISGGLNGSIGDLDNNAKNSTSAQIYNAAKTILSLKKQWTDGDSSAAQKATQYYNQLRSLGSAGQTVADFLNNANYETAKQYVNSLPKFHTGGWAYSDGLAVLKKDELIFPSDLSLKMEGLLNFLKGNPTYQNSSTSNKYDNRKEVKIDKLVNIENNHMEDEVDNYQFAREINRLVKSIL